MRASNPFKVVFTLALSLLGAGVFYALWLAAFLLVARPDRPVANVILWLPPPLLTAAGFSAGVLVAERLTQARRSSLPRLFLWPLVGCALGAGVLFWFGPMLIVFGMFLAGTASILLRELVLITRQA